MTTFSQAPLIEAIFELRWGNIVSNVGIPAVDFTDDDKELFIGQFHGAAKARGFAHVEKVNAFPGFPGTVVIPHTVTYRFRKAASSWPCYQIGLGIFTANQVNDGYDWEPFKNDILAGLELLNEGHPRGLSGIDPVVGLELRYQDGLLFDENEIPSQFLKSKLNLGFSPPQKLLKHENVAGSIEGNHIQFHLKLSKPAGQLIFQLQQALIRNKPGFVMNTIVRSHEGDEPTVVDIATISRWLEDAHSIQHDAFDSFIKPAYMRSFK